MILKADISKTSTGRYLFLFNFICGNSKCTRIQKIKKFSGEVNWVPLALNKLFLALSLNGRKIVRKNGTDFRPKKVGRFLGNSLTAETPYSKPK